MTPLERFEALVLSQKPASAPWEPVTDYSFEARKAIEGEHPQLIRDVFQPVKALDVGCGPSAILVTLLAEIDVYADGCDSQMEDAWFIEGGVVFPGDITESPLSFDFADQHDLVICREVLEHLTILQIRRAVTNLCALSSRFVYITTRFTKPPSFHLLDVDTADDLDPTHITMLNQDFLRVLFVLEGFKRRADLEAKMDWKKLGRVLVYERAV